MIVHSYARFSDPSQEGGDSLRRQWQAAEDYCEKHGYTLSDLRFTDKGRSGFKGDKQKALNAFLRAVDDGRFNRVKPCWLKMSTDCHVKEFDKLKTSSTSYSTPGLTSRS